MTAATLLGALCAAIVAYYLFVFLVSLRTTRRVPGATDSGAPLFVIVVPAHDEALVIEATIARLKALRGPRLLALVMDDGSRDGTGSLARAAAGDDERFLVIERRAEVAGRGKGAVLNDAVRRIGALVADRDPRLGGAEADEVVVGVVDADGWLEPGALAAVAPYYRDPAVAGVQLPVRIINNRDGFLTLMQDLEFVGFSLFVQAGRDPFGSVGLGGNGQFVRLSALLTLGSEPWSDCLTEDLEIGLRLVEGGWRNRFCPTSWVAQQAVTRLRPFFRQRTRWIQGHYSCWSRLPALWRARDVPLATRVDLSLYLSLVVFILVFTIQLLLTLAAGVGLIAFPTDLWAWVGDEHAVRALTLTLSVGPLVAFAVTYQRFATDPLPPWALPGVLLIFGVYGYFWAVPASIRALGRLASGRRGWVKTPRTAVAARAGAP